MQVVVNNPPDLFDKKQRAEINRMISDFEGTEFTMQHNATMLWLNAFETKMEDEAKFNHIAFPKT